MSNQHEFQQYPQGGAQPQPPMYNHAPPPPPQNHLHLHHQPQQPQQYPQGAYAYNPHAQPNQYYPAAPQPPPGFTHHISGNGNDYGPLDAGGAGGGVDRQQQSKKNKHLVSLCLAIYLFISGIVICASPSTLSLFDGRISYGLYRKCANFGSDKCSETHDDLFECDGDADCEEFARSWHGARAFAVISVIASALLILVNVLILLNEPQHVSCHVKVVRNLTVASFFFLAICEFVGYAHMKEYASEVSPLILFYLPIPNCIASIVSSHLMIHA